MSRARAEARAAIARRRWTIRAQLVALVLAVALPAVGLVAYGLVSAANEARDAAFTQVQFLATSSASRLDAVVHENAALLAKLARRPLIGALDPRRCDPIIDNLVSINPEYTTLAVRDSAANVLCTSRADPMPRDVMRKVPWFATAIADARPRVGDAYLHPRTGRWVSVLTHPLTDDNGQVAGVLILSLDLRSLQERLFKALPEGSLVSVLDRGNHFLMRSIGPDRWIGQPLPAAQRASVAGRRPGETFEIEGVDGVTRMFAVTDVPSAGWHVYAALPVDYVYAPQRQRLVESAAIGVAVILFVTALAYRIGSAISRPIGQLARIAFARAEGGRAAIEPGAATAEVAAIAAQLDRLAGERDRQRDERAALVDHYERILKAARDIYLLMDESGRIVDFNEAAVAAYGYGPEELRGMPIADLRAPPARATLEADWRRAATPGGALYETLHLRRDGTTFPVEASTRLIEIGGRTYRQGLVRDITARKQAEDVLLRQNEELDRFNRAAVGRELEVIELKRKVNALAAELGREPPYPLAFLDGPDAPGPGPGSR